MPRLRQVDLSGMTVSEVEMGLRIVSSGLAMDISPPSLSPPQLSHLTEAQWENLFWAHAELAWQRDHSPEH